MPGCPPSSSLATPGRSGCDALRSHRCPLCTTDYAVLLRQQALRKGTGEASMFAPSRSPTAMWMARSSSRRQQPDSGSACSQSLLWGDVSENSRALSLALLRLLITVCLCSVVTALSHVDCLVAAGPVGQSVAYADDRSSLTMNTEAFSVVPALEL